MKFTAKIATIFTNLGFVEKAKSNLMTAADWDAVRAAWKTEYGTELDDDRREYEAGQAQVQQNQQAEANAQQQNAAALAILNSALDATSTATPGTATEGTDGGSGATATAGAGQQSLTDESIVEVANRIASAINTMSNRQLPDTSQVITGSSLNASGPGHTASHFCGIPHDMFSMSHRYNRVALNPAVSLAESFDEEAHGNQMRQGIREYSRMFADRMSLLAHNNMFHAQNIQALSEGVNIGIAPEGLGDQYLIRRMDALIARLAKLKNVYNIFPRRFGVQDREAMINGFFSDFSQAYQKGKIWKGNVKLEPEFGYVDDAMLKTLFDSMKEMERQYIGYLNKEGSDPIKWTLIEWAVMSISKKLIEEQNKRKILGVYIKPEDGVPGHILNAGTGVYYTMLRYYNEGKIKFVPSEFASYDSGKSMVETVVAMMLHLSEEVSELDTFEVILNENHRGKWISGIREIYRNDNDFIGPDGDKVPDTQNYIRWCPYWGKLPIILVQNPGNIQCLELEAGEMHRIQFKAEMESVESWSVWKEGTSADYAGRRFDTKALRAAHGYDDQVIFMNAPSLPVDADATTVDVEGDYRHYVTGENSSATAITDIVGAKPGAAYMIEVGSESNPQTIAKSGKFAGITKAYNPTKVGDYIMVILNDAGDGFRELERCENEIRTINKALQPNVPGGR